MKTLVAALFAFSSLSSFAADKPMSATYKIDPATTKVKWEGKKVTGKHDGNIAVKNGSLTVMNDVITAGDVVVDMKTISVTDIPVTDEYNAKLLGHLTSPDFFNIAKFPEAKLVITSSEKSGNDLKVKGNLTMIGQTQPVEFLAVVKQDKESFKATSNIVLDRTKWGLKYGSGDFFKGLGDKTISNEFTLAIDLVAKK